MHKPFRCDVSKEKDWESMWEHVETTFNSKVQVLVNNAGLNPSAGWKPCIDVMLYGTMIGTFLARKKMGTSQVQTIRNEVVKLVKILIFPITAEL